MPSGMTRIVEEACGRKLWTTCGDCGDYKRRVLPECEQGNIERYSDGQHQLPTAHPRQQKSDPPIDEAITQNDDDRPPAVIRVRSRLPASMTATRKRSERRQNSQRRKKAGRKYLNELLTKLTRKPRMN